MLRALLTFLLIFSVLDGHNAEETVSSDTHLLAYIDPNVEAGHLAQLIKFLSSFASSVTGQLQKLWDNQRNFQKALDSGTRAQYELKEQLDKIQSTRKTHSKMLSQLLVPEFKAINNSLQVVNQLQADNLDLEVNTSSQRKRNITAKILHSTERHNISSNSFDYDAPNGSYDEESQTIMNSSQTMDACGDNEYFCSGSSPSRCIHQKFVCDGYNDCGDNKDERNCTRRCEQGYFDCLNGNPWISCINSTFVCDGDNDCGEFQDEINCNTISRPCSKGEIGCPGTQKCILPEMICNRHNDCGDNADEEKCARNSLSCPLNMFTCSNNERCISTSLVCDGNNDCGDNEDEANCEDFTCGSSGKNITMLWVCDGDIDCETNEDEAHCFAKDGKICNKHFVLCQESEKCISRRLVCNGNDDCGNGEDEKYCGGKLDDVIELKQASLPALLNYKRNLLW